METPPGHGKLFWKIRLALLFWVLSQARSKFRVEALQLNMQGNILSLWLHRNWLTEDLNHYKIKIIQPALQHDHLQILVCLTFVKLEFCAIASTYIGNLVQYPQRKSVIWLAKVLSGPLKLIKCLLSEFCSSVNTHKKVQNTHATLLTRLIAISSNMSQKILLLYALITSVITVTINAFNPKRMSWKNKERESGRWKQFAAFPTLFHFLAFVWEKDLSHGDLHWNL